MPGWLSRSRRRRYSLHRRNEGWGAATTEENTEPMPKGKTQRCLDLIDVCRDILEEIHPATVRAVCYQLFIRKLLPAMAKTHTNRVSTHLVYARQEEIIPWGWIVDETRKAERPGTWANPETFIPVVMHNYRRNRWELQPR